MSAVQPPRVVLARRAQSSRRRSLFFSALFFCAALASPAFAQSDDGIETGDTSGTGGRNSIQGRVYLPSGRPLEKRVRVTLSSVRGGDTRAMTDDNGAFTFRRLAGGTYRVTVEVGKEFEPATETVDIFDGSGGRGSPSGQVVSVQIQLRPRQAAAERAATLNAALASVPKPARDLYERALESARRGEHKKAVEQLKEAVGIHPEFALALNELGVQQLKLGEPERAAEAFRAALKLAPDSFAVRLNYGVVLIQQKKFADAEGQLAAALKLQDASAPAHLYRGRALIGLARHDEAERELQTALKLGGDEEMSMAYRYLGAVYIERGEAGRAVAALETYLRLAPHASEAPQIRDIIKQLRAQDSKNRK